MTINDLIDIFEYDIYVAPVDHIGQTKIKAVPIGRLMRGSRFAMGLTVVKADVLPEMCAILAWVELPGEMFSGLIKHNDNFFVTLETE